MSRHSLPLPTWPPPPFTVVSGTVQSAACACTSAQAGSRHALGAATRVPRTLGLPRQLARVCGVLPAGLSDLGFRGQALTVFPNTLPCPFLSSRLSVPKRTGFSGHPGLR